MRRSRERRKGEGGGSQEGEDEGKRTSIETDLLWKAKTKNAEEWQWERREETVWNRGRTCVGS